MRKNLLFVFAFLLGMTAMQAKPVDAGKAERLGRNFVQHKAMFAKAATDVFVLAHTFVADNGTATAYVFNFDGGFVIVSADDSYSPILGYSDHGQFDYDNAPDGLLFMLGEVNDEIQRVIEANLPVKADIASRWNNLEKTGAMRPEKGTPIVGPLIELKWNQDAPYNMYVPSGCPTGCVATAMAQLMKYWNWPVQGTGEHAYEWNGQTLSANFGETTYDWDNMIPYYANGSTDEQKVAVATLMYHCGVSVNMNYEPDGSGAYSQDVPVSISNYFSYSDHATHIGKYGNYDEWIALLKSNIDQHIPLYYSGQSSQGGHAFVCDGYDNDDLFYFNWGWGGVSNGYFLIDGEHFDYTGSQAIIYDFIPDYIYNTMPKAANDLSVTIDSDVSLIGHLSWTNPSETEAGQTLTSLDKVIVTRNGVVVAEIGNVAPGQAMSYDDEVPYFDQFDYAVIAVNGESYGRTALVTGLFGPYCEWSVIMTSANFQGWNGGGITVQNAAGTYIDFLTTTTSSAQMQRFQMALGNNNLYWVAPTSVVSSLSFKVRDANNEIVYQYEGPSSGLEEGLLRTINNSCGHENVCEAPYNLKAETDPDNDRNIVLSWDSDHDPEFGYCIYRDGFLFNMSHETRFVDENCEIGGYCYYVTALCEGGETANSNEYCATAGSGCEPPLDLHFTYTSNNRVQLDWTAPDNENITGYLVYRKTPDTPYKRIKSLTATTCKDNAAQPGTVYQYAVATYYEGINCTSAYANDLYDESKFFVLVDWSNAPTALSAELVGNEEENHVDLTWRPAYQATSYDIMRDGVKIGETTAETVFTDTELEAGRTYCYKVVAHGAEFEESTNEACVETPDAPEPPVLPCSAPVNLAGELDEMNVMHITWEEPEDRVPDGYQLTRIDMLTHDTLVIFVMNDYWEESCPIVQYDMVYKVQAHYPECESEFALTENGEDFIRFSNLSVNEMIGSVNLYPNPTSGLLTIEAENLTSVSIYNLVGQCLMEGIAKDGAASFELNGLQNGVYLVKVTTLKGSVIEKVVKM